MKPTPKTLLTLILVVGIAGIVLGFVQLNKSINGPFNDTEESSLNQTSTRDELAALQEQDTDKDNLSDFDELYLYETSPYIADSDSDGVNDNIELSLGQDPNCPEGTTCRSVPLNTASSLDDILNEDETNTNSSTNSDSNSNQAVTNPSPEDVSVSDLREALAGAGVPAETLDAIDDDTLLELYGEALQEETGTTNTNEGTTNTNTAQNSNTNISNIVSEDATVDDLQNLSIDEIRTLLKATGVPEESLDQLDDATLRAIFDESLNELSE